MKQMAVVYLICILLYLSITLSTSTSYLELLKDCTSSGPLGMINGDIQDWQITASSTYPNNWDKGCHEKYGRVYQPNGVAWCAKHKSSSEWMQVDLGLASKVTGLMTQGRGDGTEWVSSFLLSYSLDSYHWQYVSDQYGNQRVFNGNTDSYTVKHAYLDQPFYARYIKLHTVTWNRHPSMRVEIIGCQVCKTEISLPPYSKITASTQKNQGTGSHCLPEDGYLITNKAWCAKSNDVNQWLQFDIGPPTLITGLVTKGRGEKNKKHWVTRFRVSYSNDTTIWYFYKDSANQEIKRQADDWSDAGNSTGKETSIIPDRFNEEGLEFGGNTDKDSPRYHYLSSPFIARYIRFHPLEWNKLISMRAGLLGCPYQGSCGTGFLRIVNETPCVENLSYKKESWINNKRQYKRHVRNQWLRGHAARAVDGNSSATMQSCTVLDNFYVDKPTWMVDLGRKVKVSGVKIVTWQGSDTDGQATYKEYLNNLDRLTVYVDGKGGKQHSPGGLPADNVCGFISRFNDAIFQPLLHVQCAAPLRGRYVYIEASGVATRWTRLFSAILCEVLVYE